MQLMVLWPPGRVILKTITKMVQTASLFGTHALDRNLAIQHDCVQGRVVCGILGSGSSPVSGCDDHERDKSVWSCTS